MKRFLAFLFTAVTVLSIMSSSVLAVEPEEKVIDLGDGFYAVETISQYPAGRSGDTGRGRLVCRGRRRKGSGVACGNHSGYVHCVGDGNDVCLSAAGAI